MEHFDLFVESFIRTIPQIIVLIFCLKYYLQTRNKNSIYLTVGSFMVMISIFFSSLSFLLLYEYELDPVLVGVIGGSINLIGLIGAFLFAFGLRKFIKRLLGLLTNKQTDTIDQIGNS